MAESVELKPCPFDGGEAWIIEDRGDRGSLPLLYRPQCKKCGADRGGYRTKAEAIEAWNRRVSAAPSEGGERGSSGAESAARLADASMRSGTQHSAGGEG